jgi:hypothetical protein
MRRPSGSVPPSARFTKNKRAIYVFGAVSLSTTLTIRLGFSAEKYSAAARTSASVAASAAAVMRRPALLCGPENFLAPLLKSAICCTK